MLLILFMLANLFPRILGQFFHIHEQFVLSFPNIFIINIKLLFFPGAATSLSLLNVVTMATGPDGSIFVGDYNLIRKIDPQGNVLTILQFRWVLHYCYLGLTQVVNLATNTIWTWLSPSLGFLWLL